MEDSKNRIVYLPHPGTEHIIDFNKVDFENTNKKKYQQLIQDNDRSGITTIFPWNKGDHRRKFICSEGKCTSTIDGQISDVIEDLYFWGEWEQPSIVTMLPSDSREIINNVDPTYLHMPLKGKLNECEDDMYERYNSKENPHVGYQNTDPYVFGDRFYYSCCRQVGKVMKSLKRGDIILFYSGIEKNSGNEENARTLMLDTVFVVAGAYLEYGRDSKGVWIKYKNVRFYNDEIKNEIAGKVTDTYLNGVLNAIWFGREAKSDTAFGNVLYYGATPKDRVDGMFSYFICKTGDEGKRGFRRASYKAENNEFGFSYSLQKQKYIIENNSILGHINDENIRWRTKDYWRKLTEDILNKKYKLGYYAKEPQ